MLFFLKYSVKIRCFERLLYIRKLYWKLGRQGIFSIHTKSAYSQFLSASHSRYRIIQTDTQLVNHARKSLSCVKWWNCIDFLNSVTNVNSKFCDSNIDFNKRMRLDLSQGHGCSDCCGCVIACRLAGQVFSKDICKGCCPLMLLFSIPSNQNFLQDWST